MRGVFTFGRFNPPTIGHEKLIKKVADVAKGDPFYIYPSWTHNSKKDPLPHPIKVKWMRKIFPKYSNQIISNPDCKTAIHVLAKLNDQFDEIVMVVGSDRIKDFLRLFTKYNGVKSTHGFYQYEKITVASAGERDPDAQGVEGMSASKMRAAATEGDFESFKMGIPDTVSNTVKKGLYNDVRKYIGVKEEYIQERELTIREKRLKEKYVLELKKKSDEFKKKYGDKWLDVIYATATNMAKKQSIKESSYLKNYEDFIGWLND